MDIFLTSYRFFARQVSIFFFNRLFRIVMVFWCYWLFSPCRLFKRGLSFVGRDYHCYNLWDKYIEYEYSQERWSSLANIYIQTLKFPTKKLHQYYERFVGNSIQNSYRKCLNISWQIVFSLNVVVHLKPGVAWNISFRDINMLFLSIFIWLPCLFIFVFFISLMWLTPSWHLLVWDKGISYVLLWIIFDQLDEEVVYDKPRE